MGARWIAAAIFGGCVVIAVALYLALRPPAPVRPPPRPVPAMPVVRSEREVTSDVTAALVANLPAWRAACWDPAIAITPEPATSRYTFDLTIGPDGREVARGISELRDEPSRADVARCLRALPDRLQVRPPNKARRVQVWLRFPR